MFINIINNRIEIRRNDRLKANLYSLFMNIKAWGPQLTSYHFERSFKESLTYYVRG